MSKKVFIGGSRMARGFSDLVRDHLIHLTEEGAEFLIGDANGADKTAQKFLAQLQYESVTIYHTGDECRNNIGGWKRESVTPNRKTKDYKYYAAKDLEMSKAADEGVMLWDGKSTGTINNVLNLLSAGKEALVYHAPEDDCFTVTSFDDVETLLKTCAEEDIETMEKKIDLRQRMTQTQTELPLS